MRCDVRRQPWPSLAALGAALALAGCGSSGPGGVAVDSLQTNVVFGAEQPGQRAVAYGANLVPRPPAPSLAFPIPPSFALPAFSGPLFQLPSGGPCPAAPENAFPAEAASSDVPLAPAAGASRWLASGTYDVAAGGVTVPYPVATGFDELVRKVQPFTDTFPQSSGGQQGLDYTYDMVEPQLNSPSGGFIQLVWQVKSNPAAGDPEGGLALVEVDTIKTPGGPATAIFAAAAHDGLLVMPLPAAPGPVQPAVVSLPPPPQPPVPLPLPTTAPTAPSSTESVDTSGNGHVLQFSGSVGVPERIDACGTWLQAWPVDGTLTDGSASAVIHMDVATQFGAVPISFDIDGTFLGATYHKLVTHTGQATPSPLPREWQ